MDGWECASSMLPPICLCLGFDVSTLRSMASLHIHVCLAGEVSGTSSQNHAPGGEGCPSTPSARYSSSPSSSSSSTSSSLVARGQISDTFASGTALSAKTSSSARTAGLVAGTLCGLHQFCPVHIPMSVPVILAGADERPPWRSVELPRLTGRPAAVRPRAAHGPRGLSVMCRRVEGSFCR